MKQCKSLEVFSTINNFFFNLHSIVFIYLYLFVTLIVVYFNQFILVDIYILFEKNREEKYEYLVETIYLTIVCTTVLHLYKYVFMFFLSFMILAFTAEITERNIGLTYIEYEYTVEKMYKVRYMFTFPRYIRYVQSYS